MEKMGIDQSPMQGILTDADLKSEIQQGRLIRLPGEAWLNAYKSRSSITKDSLLEQVEACSVDLTIGTIFNRGEIKREGYVTLQPGEVISLFTLEELEMPEDIAATAFPLNSQSSEGLLVLNPGHIDPGYVGPMTVKAINVKKTELSVNIGDKIFTLIFQRLPKPVRNRYDRSIANREKKEIEFNKKDVVNTPRGLANIVSLDKETPFVTKDQVSNAIKDHWMPRLTITLTVLVLVIAICSFIYQIIISTWNMPSGASDTQTEQMHQPSESPPGNVIDLDSLPPTGQQNDGN